MTRPCASPSILLATSPGATPGGAGASQRERVIAHRLAIHGRGAGQRRARVAAGRRLAFVVPIGPATRPATDRSGQRSARADAGYEVNVTGTGSTQIVTGDPPRMATAPENVRAVARKP